MILEVHEPEIIWKISKTVDLENGEFYGAVEYNGDQLFKYLMDKKVE